jgi:hypothetical protein
LEVASLEGRRLLSDMDLGISATVTTFRNGVPAVQPMMGAYATNADSVQVAFNATDPDDVGSTPTAHFNILDTTTGATVVSGGMGASWTLSQEGNYQVQYWATDSDEPGPTPTQTIFISIDRTAPTVTINTVEPNVLWPPNGKFVTVTVTGMVSDSLSGVNPATLGFHVHDEYHQVEPSGPITDVSETGPTPFGGFADATFSFQVALQARRHGFDFDGRHYIIDVFASDMAGNTGSDFSVVIVPHDRGKNHGFHNLGSGQNGNQGGGDQDQGSGHHGNNAGSHPGRTGANPVTGPAPPTVGHGHGDKSGSHGHGHDKGGGNANGNGGGDQGQGNSGGNGQGNDNSGGNGNGGGAQGQGNGNGGGIGNGNGKGNGNGNGGGKGHGNPHG